MALTRVCSAPPARRFSHKSEFPGLYGLTMIRQTSDTCPLNALGSNRSRHLLRSFKRNWRLTAVVQSPEQSALAFLRLAIFSPCRHGVRKKCTRSDVRPFTQKLSDPLSALQTHPKQSTRLTIPMIHHRKVGVRGVLEHCSVKNAAGKPHARNNLYPYRCSIRILLRKSRPGAHVH